MPFLTQFALGWLAVIIVLLALWNLGFYLEERRERRALAREMTERLAHGAGRRRVRDVA